MGGGRLIYSAWIAAGEINRPSALDFFHLKVDQGLIQQLVRNLAESHGTGQVSGFFALELRIEVIQYAVA